MLPSNLIDQFITAASLLSSFVIVKVNVILRLFTLLKDFDLYIYTYIKKKNPSGVNNV